MADVLLGIVIENLGSFLREELATFLGVDELTQKLSRNLTAIRAVLQDAEQKQITSQAVKVWLQNLADAAHVLDDILDECSITSKAHVDDKCINCFRPKKILDSRDIGKRMKAVAEKIDAIAAEGQTYKLQTGDTGEPQRVEDEWRQTTSVVAEQKVYGRDCDRDQEQLIHLWLANGFISSRGNLDVEHVGQDVWNELYALSFFQEVKTDEKGNVTFKMHDLFHDLARSIMGEECVASGAASLTNLSSRVHHISSLPSNTPLRALRTSPLQHSALKGLTHLRYLEVFESPIKSLPRSICKLQNLQILKLDICPNLSSLPNQLTQLQDLRHLVIKHCTKLVSMPSNISKLTCLKTLSTFIVGSKMGFGLAELHDLQLGGKLHIKGLENVSSEWDAKEANLIGKKELNRLYLSWDIEAKSQGIDTNVERVLEVLEPPTGLKGFGMKGYLGIHLPHWMRNTSILEGLVDVILYNCKNCQRLPPLEGMGDLPCLERLEIRDCPKLVLPSNMNKLTSLRQMTIQCYDGNSRILEGIEVIPSLQNLTLLRFNDLPESLGDMTSLQRVDIVGCLNLRSLPNSFQNLKNLHTLIIFICPMLDKRCKKGTGEDWKKIAHVPELELISKEKSRHLENSFSEWKMEVHLMHRNDEFSFIGSFEDFERIVDAF
ncbi:hypothetical protein QL285_031528 [Trifolium repens]|nr:hypothetical protein QL285_031528 [Trifolium repens]